MFRKWPKINTYHTTYDTNDTYNIQRSAYLYAHNQIQSTPFHFLIRLRNILCRRPHAQYSYTHTHMHTPRTIHLWKFNSSLCCRQLLLLVSICVCVPYSNSSSSNNPSFISLFNYAVAMDMHTQTNCEQISIVVADCCYRLIRKWPIKSITDESAIDSTASTLDNIQYTYIYTLCPIQIRHTANAKFANLYHRYPWMNMEYLRTYRTVCMWRMRTASNQI